MNEQQDGNSRFWSWFWSLSREEQDEAHYVINDLKGDFATAYLSVRIMRLENRSPFRVGIKEILALLAAVAAALGLTKGPLSQ